jgi:hypothetical protein
VVSFLVLLEIGRAGVSLLLASDTTGLKAAVGHSWLVLVNL